MLFSLGGLPFVIRGAELHNSSSSSPGAIRTAITSVAGRAVNTVLAPISWDQLEPEEGVFDFRLVDDLLSECVTHGLHLIPLWFGSWKNASSSYSPVWVRTDPSRFPRATSSLVPHPEHLSAFGTESAKADARAFRRLMEHLRMTDLGGTVVAVQVENEVGLLGDSRDRSDLANKAFRSQVPEHVLDAIAGTPDGELHGRWAARGKPRIGDWEECLGEGSETDEAFMAWAYATYVESVAASGKSEFDRPLFVNAWLNSDIDLPGFSLAGGGNPGVYPSGGPLPHVAEIWAASAPSLALLAPDIYFGDFDDVCASYAGLGKGLFIPEMIFTEEGAGDTFVAIGKHGAAGVSYFGLDSADDTRARHSSDAFSLIGKIEPELLRVGPGARVGFHLTDSHPSVTWTVGDLALHIERFAPLGSDASQRRGYGIILQTGPTDFLAAGRGFAVTFEHSGDRVAAIGRVEEIDDVRATASPTRVLNGDETRSGTAWFHPALPDVGERPFRIPELPAGTGVSRCSVYVRARAD